MGMAHERLLGAGGIGPHRQQFNNGEKVNIVTLDFETYFDSDYTLKKMTTEAYVRDPRFEVLGAAIRTADGQTRWIAPSVLRTTLSSVDWSSTALLCHHAQFDGLILSHHYGIKPHAWLDTLSMARLVLGNHVSVGLGSLAQHFNLAAKSVPYDDFRGQHWGDLSPAIRRAVADGACHDAALTWQIFGLLAKGFPAEEYQTIDSCVRFFTEPCLMADVPALKQVWANEAVRKEALLAEVGCTVKELRSDAKFAELLRAEGVEPATKPGTNGPIYAFAKSDKFMKDLEEHDNARVAALAAARVGNKTSIKQTRAVRMAHMAQRGPMCIYLSYAGAHTTRFAGGDKLNFQNPPPDIKRTLMAPPGHKLAIVDAAQIECRILNYLAGQQDVIERFRNGEDPYVNVASEFYKRPITKENDPEERQVGKVLELQCGFGSGAQKIRETLRIRAGILLSDDDALRARDAYRNTHPRVVDYWKEAELNLKRMNSLCSFEWGPMSVQCGIEAETRRIVLPNGAPLIYDMLEWYTDPETGEAYWRIKLRNKHAKLYGAKLVENVVQALARVVVTQAMNRIKAAGIRIATMTHDDIVCCIPDDHNIHNTYQFIKDQMKLTPGWLPGCPLGVDGVISDRYEK